MDPRHLQDRLNWGLNRAANIVGQTADAFRPAGSIKPLNPVNRFMRLPAWFSRDDGDHNQPVGYGNALWRGYFDSAYTRPGDYLVQGQSVWFIASQQNLLPILCVKTNATITISRPAAPGTGSSYGASTAQPMETVIAEWPVSVLGISSDQRPPSGLPADTTVPRWTMLLPSVHGAQLWISDVITDARGVASIVEATEETDLGWRLNIRRATT